MKTFKKYRNTTTVEAIRVEPGLADPYLELIEKYGGSASFTMGEIRFSFGDDDLHIAYLGDYIIHHGNDDFSVMSAEDFERNYTAEETTDWHDLTAALNAGEPIDWDKLDGRRAKCEHTSGIEVYHKFERDNAFPANKSLGHFTVNPRSWRSVLVDSWYGDDGWTLYIDGPVPMKRKTADQLDDLQTFKGKREGAEENENFVIAQFITGKKWVLPMSTFETLRPDTVEVIEETGRYELDG